MPTGRRPLLLLALLALLAAAVGLRCHPAVMTTSDAGVDFVDADTVRRLVKIRNLEQADHYPVREPRDGFPEGALIQWSLPMDWTIQALDAVAPRIHPAARPNETGAALAGPVLGALAVLAFALCAWRLVPSGQAAVAAVLYAVSGPGVEVTRLGNGDHQSLQLLLVLIAMLGGMAVVSGRAGRGLALGAGAALGLGLWVNAESMLALVVVGLVVLVGFAGIDPAAVRERRRAMLGFAAAAVAIALPGQLIENGGALTLEWDRISCFQSAAALGLLAFVAAIGPLLDRLGRPALAVPAAALAAGALVAAPFLLVPTLRETLGSELARMATFSGFCAACVAEYHALFADGVQLARLVYGETLWLILPCFAGLFVAGGDRTVRWTLVVPVVLLGVLVLDQVKLAHMFAIPWALLLPVGGAGLLRLAERRGILPAAAAPRVRVFAGLTVVALATWHILVLTFPAPSPGQERANEERRAVVAAVGALELGASQGLVASRPAVMAPWELGHHLLYETDKPIVASSYQRRVDGIRDSFDVLCSQTPEEARAILQRRRVRWWVRQGDPSFLVQYDKVVPGRPRLAMVMERDGKPALGLDRMVKSTFWARTASGATLPPWLELVYESAGSSSPWGMSGPAYRVFRVRYEDEG